MMDRKVHLQEDIDPLKFWDIGSEVWRYFTFSLFDIRKNSLVFSFFFAKILNQTSASLLEIIANTDLRHGFEFAFNCIQEATLVRGARTLIDFN